MTFGRSLSFKPHLKGTVKQAERNKILIKVMANTSWGWYKKDLKKVWTAHVLNYVAGGWQPKSATPS